LHSSAAGAPLGEVLRRVLGEVLGVLDASVGELLGRVLGEVVCDELGGTESRMMMMLTTTIEKRRRMM
jgi:hypothetical protein